jgi:hypothetical protein
VRPEVQRAIMALQRMWKRGHQWGPHYAELRRKTVLLIRGRATVIDVSEQVIGDAGALLARISWSSADHKDWLTRPIKPRPRDGKAN